MKWLFRAVLLIFIVLGVNFNTLKTATPKVVFLTNNNLSLRGFNAFYKSKPLNGVIIQKLPFTESFLHIEYLNGKAQGVPMPFDLGSYKSFKIPFLNKKILVSLDKEDLFSFLVSVELNI